MWRNFGNYFFITRTRFSFSRILRERELKHHYIWRSLHVTSCVEWGIPFCLIGVRLGMFSCSRMKFLFWACCSLIASKGQNTLVSRPSIRQNYLRLIKEILKKLHRISRKSNEILRPNQGNFYLIYGNTGYSWPWDSLSKLHRQCLRRKRNIYLRLANKVAKFESTNILFLSLA